MKTLFGRVWLNGRGIIPIGGVSLRWSSKLAGQDAPPTVGWILLTAGQEACPQEPDYT